MSRRTRHVLICCPQPLQGLRWLRAPGPACPCLGVPGPGPRAPELWRPPCPSSSPPQPDLLSLLSGKTPAPDCDNCPLEDPSAADVYCGRCNTNLCSGCDGTLHSGSMQPFVMMPAG
eukprot:gene6848-biopygen5641